MDYQYLGDHLSIVILYLSDPSLLFKFRQNLDAYFPFSKRQDSKWSPEWKSEWDSSRINHQIRNTLFKESSKQKLVLITRNSDFHSGNHFESKGTGCILMRQAKFPDFKSLISSAYGKQRSWHVWMWTTKSAMSSLANYDPASNVKGTMNNNTRILCIIQSKYK